MYNVVIFGTGQTSRVVISGLNQQVNIVAFCDNNMVKWNTYLEGKKIVEPEELKNINYDYIIIASQFNDEIYEQLLKLGISKNRILQFFKYINLSSNYIQNKINQINKDREIEVFITGISYLVKGINISYLEKKAFNMANPSQDLYYDYNLIKYLIDTNPKSLSKYKYSIIGLCMYSFQYDLSLSSMKTRVPIYYKSIGKSNNLSNVEKYIDDFEMNSNISNKLFKFNEEGHIILNWYKNEKNIYKMNNEIGKTQALLDGNKDYPKTVKQNTIILKDYLKLLKKNDIKPILIVCPVSRYYADYFPNRLKNEFYNIINEIRTEYEFQLLDYFNSDLFKDEDFYDVSHLNDKGAEKFTKLLNNKIEW